MILFFALAVTLAAAAALLIHQYRSRALAGGEPSDDAAESPIEERRAA